jgi:hypothetical protein
MGCFQGDQCCPELVLRLSLEPIIARSWPRRAIAVPGSLRGSEEAPRIGPPLRRLRAAVAARERTNGLDADAARILEDGTASTAKRVRSSSPQRTARLSPTDQNCSLWRIMRRVGRIPRSSGMRLRSAYSQALSKSSQRSRRMSPLRSIRNSSAAKFRPARTGYLFCALDASGPPHDIDRGA